MIKHIPQNRSLNINVPRTNDGSAKLVSFKIEIVDAEILPQRDIEQLTPIVSVIMDKAIKNTGNGKFRNSNRIEFKEVQQ